MLTCVLTFPYAQIHRILSYREGRLSNQRFYGKEAQKVLWVFRLIERIDRVPVKYLKKLAGSDDIWECRVLTRLGTYRIFSFFFRGDRLVVTHGYSKKTQKTDPREIRRAERYRLDYLRRHEENTNE